MFKFIFVVGLFLSALAKGGTETHGGDQLKLTFDEGQSKAIQALRSMSLRTWENYGDYALWMLRMRWRLIDEVGGSKLVWVDGELSTNTCAQSISEPKADIRLSLPDCRLSVANSNEAAALLVHEAVHHLGVGDEIFAGRVQRVVLNFLRFGEPSTNQNLFGALAYSRATGASGWSWDANDSNAAATSAMAACVKPDCETVINVQNSCAAIAYDSAHPEIFAYAYNQRRDIAEREAATNCARNAGYGEKCNKVSSTCSTSAIP